MCFDSTGKQEASLGWKPQPNTVSTRQFLRRMVRTLERGVHRRGSRRGRGHHFAISPSLVILWAPRKVKCALRNNSKAPGGKKPTAIVCLSLAQTVQYHEP